ncbi:hypothetical protein [Leptothrix discophora]|uniref:Uncharacterized protein n=1 Tax=Leptothrix discophora TaxID=89 RepID=A0ABT9G6G7_LEPDI|nr:hypothetical protein [Leptothrix discophora]MDP4302084.1 hypothetical protein [Leptothrix discophora]
MLQSLDLDGVYARTLAGRAQVLRLERPTSLAQHLMLRLNGYTPLREIVTREEEPLVPQALQELLQAGWIEVVRPASDEPTESQWGSLGQMDLAA